MHADERRFDYLIEESRCGIGGAGAVQEQIEHQSDLMSLTGVTIGLVPIGPSRRRWPDESFWMLDSSRVTVGLISGDLELTDVQNVAEYARRFDQLAEQAVFRDDARRLIDLALAALN